MNIQPVITQWQRPVVETVTLALAVPPSNNQLTRNTTAAEKARSMALGKPPRPRVKTASYRTWIVAAGNQINIQRPGRINGNYRLSILLPRGVKLDLGNCEKAISDLLQTHGIIANDRMAEHITVGWHSGKDECLVSLSAVERRAA